MKIGAVTKATEGGGGGEAFQKEHLVIFFNPLQLEIGTLLLNCSFYGYRGLYRQPFQRLSLRSRTEPSYLRGFCFIAAYNIICVKTSHRDFLSSIGSKLPALLETTHTLSILRLYRTRSIACFNFYC